MRCCHKILKILSTVTLVACAPANDGETSLVGDGPSFFSKFQDEIDRNSPVKLELSTGPRGSGFSLQSSMTIENIHYEIDQCASGYQATFTAVQGVDISLYRHDRNCRLSILQIDMDQKNYTLTSPPFVDEENQVNTYANSEGEKIYIVPVATLPEVLSDSSYQLRYLLTRHTQGQGFSLEIQELAIFSDTDSIMENDTLPLLITIVRSSQAQGPLDVTLESVGSAELGLDFNGMPSSVSMASGVYETSFSINMVDDQLIEGDEDIRIRLGAGVYFPSIDHHEAVIQLIDDDIPMGYLELFGSGNLGTRALGYPLDQELQIVNTGNLPVTMEAMSWQSGVFSFVGGSYPGTGGSCAGNLDPDSSCTVRVTTATNQLGLRSDILQAQYQDGQQTRQLSVGIQVEVVEAAHLVVSQPILDFGSHGVGSTASLNLTLSNIGASPASTLSLAQDLALPFYFPNLFPGQGSNCGSTLPAGASCELVMSFSPTSPGVFQDSVVIAYDDGTTQQRTMSYGVQGEGGSLGFILISNAPHFDFGPATIGQAAIQHFVLRNDGQSIVQNLSATVQGDGFAFVGGSYPGTGGNCQQQLAAGSQCSVVVSFNPQSSGNYSGVFQVTYHNQMSQLTASLTMSGQASHIKAVAETYIVGVDSSVAVELKAKNGVAPLQFSVLAQPDHGSLSGTPPQLTYTPEPGFKGRDYFSFRVSDSQGQSQLALIRLLVAPKALYVSSSSLTTIDSQAISVLENHGVEVFLRSDSQATFADSIGKDLVLVSQSANASTIGQTFRNLQIPFIGWDHNLYPHMGMSSATADIGSHRTESLNIINAAHPMAKGFNNGVYQVFGHFNYHMPYLVSNHPNLQKIATMDGFPSRNVMFGYESQAQMVGNFIAPARRVGTFLAGSGPSHGLTADGQALFNNSVLWAMGGVDSLFVDHFQRPDQPQLNDGWQEFESSQSGFKITNARLTSATTSEPAFTVRSFERRLSGVLSSHFLMSLSKAAHYPAVEEQFVSDGYCAEQAWTSTQIYDTNHRAYHNGSVWRAKWYTQGEEPGTTGQWGVWENVAACPLGPQQAPGPGCDASWWQSSSIYQEADKVAHVGSIWRARWYTQNQEPGTTGQWGVWEDLGPCPDAPATDRNYWFRLQLGQCDLMNTQDIDAGVAVQVIWGGPEAGLTDHESIGVQDAAGNIQTLGFVNESMTRMKLQLDLDQKSFQVHVGDMESAEFSFEKDVHVDCVRVASRKINSANFTGFQVDNLRIFAAE
ncbi:MAG: choice-of-anchor D domain-containing protein [Oligoflexus sp.]